LLALFLQKIAIAVLGFLARGQRATVIAAAFFFQYSQYTTIIFVIGGLIGAILLLVFFDWALIVVSSLIGAHLIQSAITLPASGSTIVFIGLAVIGILVQAASFRRGRVS
jgi:flagellar biogenesis protein FliO